jgi:hypothetical protein
MATRQPFGVGAVLSRSFASWISNFLPFTVLAALIYLPIELYTWYVLRDLDAITADDLWRWVMVVVPGGLILRVVLIGTLVYGVFRELQGRRATIAETVSVGLRRLLPVFGVAILLLLAVTAAGIPLFLVIGIMQSGNALGLVLLIPAAALFFSVLCRLWVSIPVAVVEKPGVMESLTRSAELTKGRRGSIFLILLLLGIFERVVDKILEITFPVDTIDDFPPLAWATVIALIEMAILQAITATVIYNDLRLEKEGVGIEELAQVFD